jgi:hypothetical protein
VHHITKARNSLWPVLPKIPVDAWVGDAVVEAVDDVVLRDICDGGVDVKKATCVGPQELVTFLFTLSKIVTSTCASNRSLEVVDEDLLEPLPGVDGVVAETLQPCERRRVESHREVDNLGDVRAPCDLNGRGVATQPLLRSLLGVVLGDANRLEALRVLVATEPCRKSWEAVATVSTFGLDFLVYLAPGVDHRPRIAAFIDVLAQVFCRRLVIGLPRVTPWRWLLPPARGLTPTDVVVVVARLRLRATTSCSAVSLAPALAHALLPDGRRRVVQIQLDPGPLRVKERLTNTRIITALEYCHDPGDVGHRSSEAPLAHGGELRVKLAMHRSPALVDPPPPDCAGSIPGPPRLTNGVVLITGVGCDLIFRYSIEFDDVEVAIVLEHRQLARQVGERVEDPPASSMASFRFTKSVPSHGTTFVFGSWVCIADGVGDFRRFLVDMKPKTPVADLRSDLDKFVDNLDDLLIHASVAKIKMEFAPGSTSSGAAATSLGLESF